jgi:hypothetical protein
VIGTFTIEYIPEDAKKERFETSLLILVNKLEVPIEENSQKMVADVGSNVHLEVIDGGFHGTGNYAFYGDIINQAFKDYPSTYDYT